MASGSTPALRPSGTVALAVTATSASIALAGAGSTVLATNTGSKVAFVDFGGAPAAVASATGSTPVLPGASVLFDVGPLVSYAAAVCGGSDTTTICFTHGEGSTR